MIRNHLTSLFLSLLESSAADPIRDTLTAKSDAWFRGVWVSGIVVAVGCVLEAWEVSRTLKNWNRARKNEELLPENPGSCMHLMAAVGLLLVVGGIVSETVFEVLDANVESEYRSHEADRIAEADDKAASATLQAGDAAKSALTAHEESSAAKATAGEANKLASGARSEADSFEQDIQDAEQASTDARGKAADAESHLANALERANNAEKQSIHLRDILSGWKLDENAKSRFVKDVSGFAGTSFDLAVNPVEGAFMEQLDGILTSKEIGWIRVPPPPGSIGLTILIDGKASVLIQTGIILEVDRDQSDLQPALIALGKAFHEELEIPSIPVHLVPAGTYGKRIHIIIGKRE